MKRREQPPPPPAGGTPLVLYVHVPFCEELCGYCTFNRERFEEGLARRYFEALREEIRMYHQRGFAFDSLYVGGGTPTVLPEELSRTIVLVRSLWNPRVISVETHPNHLTEPVCAVLEAAGVNRLSVGVQSFQEEVLVGLERGGQRIGPDEARERLSRSIGRFKTVNIDMIFDVPGQTADALWKDVRAIKELSPHQVTFYPLMSAHPPRGLPEVPSRRLYALIWGGLRDRYRIASGWSFSLNAGSPLDEYITQSEDYAGLGAGSFGYVDGVFYANTFSIPEYIHAVGQGKFPVALGKRFRTSETVRYHFLIRLFSGFFDLLHAVRKFGVLPLLQLWKDALLAAGAGGIPPGSRTRGLTEKGRFLSMIMMKEFFSAVSVFRERCRERTTGIDQPPSARMTFWKPSNDRSITGVSTQ